MCLRADLFAQKMNKLQSTKELVIDSTISIGVNSLHIIFIAKKIELAYSLEHVKRVDQVIKFRFDDCVTYG